MKKIVLIFPNNFARDSFDGASDPPLGLASIASVLLKEGFLVYIIDANAENLELDDIIERLKKMEPDIVGISCNYSPLHNPTLKLANLIKKEFDIPIIVGGNHATAMAEYMLKNSEDIDYIVRGEGEITFLNLVKALNKGENISEIKGISYKSASQIVHTSCAPLISDINVLPMPAYHLLPMNKYKRYNVITSRGCPFDCLYCASKVIFKSTVRYKSPKLVLDEIEYLLREYGDRHVWFSDDTFISNKKYTFSLLAEIKKRNLKFKWSCLTRVGKSSKELLKEAKECGCDYISYGIESGNQKILNKIGKKITVEEILETINITSEVGIRQYGFFIVGFPGETWETIMDSYKLILKSKINGAAFNILIPLPGTKLMDELINSKIINLEEIKWDYLFARSHKETYERYSAELISKVTNLSGDELLEACKIGHRLPSIRNYVYGF